MVCGGSLNVDSILRFSSNSVRYQFDWHVEVHPLILEKDPQKIGNTAAINLAYYHLCKKLVLKGCKKFPLLDTNFHLHQVELMHFVMMQKKRRKKII